jgi:pimeloyl-ACP methyl ester carboxylesterase
MATQTIATTSADTRIKRYRQAERALWADYGLEPAERFVELRTPAARLRLLDVGSGEPVLFVHGTVGPGSWPALVRELRGFRCLVLDRPGWGLSSAVVFSRSEFKAVVEQPAVYIYGTADPVGTVDVYRRVTELLPRGKLVLLDGLGHQPWLDDPSKVAAIVGSFLAES